jgi:hypothetical protein
MLRQNAKAQNENMKNNSSVIPVIQESERVIAEAIKHFKLTCKPEQIYLTIQSAGRKNALGWFGPQHWTGKDKKHVHEINLCAEHLQTHNMGETLLHELAHAENEVLGIKDCSGSRMHNRKFKSMAEKLGLEVKPRDRAVGFGYTDLADEGKKFLASIKFDLSIFSSHRNGGASGKAKKPGSRLVRCECDNCGYICRTTQKWLDDVGAPHCPEHGAMTADATTEDEA